MTTSHGRRMKDPAVRLGLGLGLFALSRLALRPDHVGPAETWLFRKVNGLGDAPSAPVWLAMQPGALGAVPVAASLAYLSGRRALAPRLLLAGVGAWSLAKLVKRCTVRPRPDALLAGTHLRGSPQRGLGFVSGHAAVATSLCLMALPELPRRARALAVTGTIVVACGRVYTGAHLPLDIAGGVGLGMAVEAVIASAG